MRKISAAAILASILAIGVFGFVAMRPEAAAKMAGCIAAAMNGGACPSAAGNPLEQSFFHLNAFRSLSLATFADGLLAFLALVLPFALAGAAIFYPPKLGIFSPSRFRETVRALPLALRRFIRYLSLFTHSPCLV